MVPHCSSLLRPRLAGRRGVSGLLVGCGNGDEVVYLRRAFGNAGVVGIDVRATFSGLARLERCVVVGDVTRLPVKSEAFDFAAAFHSLEHVGDAQGALDEIRRVLRPGGWFYVGVPNKSRLLGYLGSFDATPGQKIAWNLSDWWARVRGKFRNEQGAHAGFERRELANLLQGRFSNVQFVTEEYIRFKYGGRFPQLALDFLLRPGVIDYSAPAHYVLCQRLD